MEGWKKGAVIGGLLGFIFHTTIVWYVTPTSVFRGMGIEGNLINLLRSTFLGAFLGLIIVRLMNKFKIIKEIEDKKPTIEYKNTRDDYLIPIGLSTLLAVLFFFGVVLLIGLAGSGNPPRELYVLILTTYAIMFFFTKFATRNVRVLVFPVLGLLAIFIFLIGAFYVEYSNSMGHKGDIIQGIGGLIGLVAFLGLGYTFGNLVLKSSRRMTL